MQKNKVKEEDRKVHELLPSIREAENEPSKMYSDHLPIRFQVNTGNHQLVIISWNILDPFLFSGCHATAASYKDNKQLEQRLRRIAQALKLFIDEHNPEIITLQEVVMREGAPDFKNILKEYLGDNWAIVKGQQGLMTCYNKTNLTIGKDNIAEDSANDTVNINEDSTAKKEGNGDEWVLIPADDTSNEDLDGLSSNDDEGSRHTFNFIYHGQKITIHNVHTRHQDFPDGTEYYYHQLLQQSKNTIVAGDTNSRIAPPYSPNLSKKNIVTNVIPPQFRSPTKVADFTTGAFSKFGEGINYSQIPRDVLNYLTGKIYQEGEYDTSKLDVTSDYRPVICLDHHYFNDKIIGDQTIYNYQISLSKCFNDPGIMVRMASTSMNERAIVIAFSNRSPKYEAIKQQLPQDSTIQLQMIEGGITPMPCLFCPIDKINELHKLDAFLPLFKHKFTKFRGTLWLSPYRNSGMQDKLNNKEIQHMEQVLNYAKEHEGSTSEIVLQSMGIGPGT